MKILISILFLSTVVIGQNNARMTQKELMTADSVKNKNQLSIAEGVFQPNWNSFNQRKFPEWFRNAKFGIWAHWGPQSAPEYGDWYARNMYDEKNGAYKFHLKKYGHPSEFGFKDVIPTWTADKFDADKLTSLFKNAGARYIVTMANHHDNFDNWNSKFQPWNSVNIGPKRDIVGLWKKATTKQGLRFGVSIHNINTWGWYDTARGADSTGLKAGIPYDGYLTKADGKGKWWDGYDPQDLYGPMHVGGPNGDQPTAAFIKNWFLRTKDLIDTYQPDILEFDLWSPSNIWRQWVKFDNTSPEKGLDERVGTLIAQHYFNQERNWHKGADEGIITLKGIDKERRGSMTEALERDYSKEILPDMWQLEESMGDWHYQGEGRTYLSTDKVVAMLAEAACRNGNLLLNVVMRPDGTVAGDQEETLLKVGRWLETNGEAIYGSRPFSVMGEGPHRMKSRAELKEEHLPNVLPTYTPEDIRFTSNQGAVYAIVLAPPTGDVLIKSVAGMKIKSVSLLGTNTKISWKQTKEGLLIQFVKTSLSDNLPLIYKIKSI
ncbi:MAG: alpha-L-fucosidase [Paludibacter sp.]